MSGPLTQFCPPNARVPQDTTQGLRCWQRREGSVEEGRHLGHDRRAGGQQAAREPPGALRRWAGRGRRARRRAERG
eukprot:6454825-Prymnesium_polylepis.1